MQNYEKVNLKLKHIVINNFLGGISWGIGATLGLGIVVALIGFLVSQIDFVPVVGEFVANVWEAVLQKNPQLLR